MPSIAEIDMTSSGSGYQRNLSLKFVSWDRRVEGRRQTQAGCLNALGMKVLEFDTVQELG